MPGDSVDDLAQEYDTKNVGIDKTLSVTGYTVNDGNSGGNYDVTLVDNVTGEITKADLTITANNQAKTYGETFVFDGTEFTPWGSRTAR